VGRLPGSLFAPALALAALALATATAALPGAAPGCTMRVKTSWADARHGWELRTDDTGTRCGDRLYATDDRGRTWRVVHQEPSGPIADLLRTSVRAGVIFPARWHQMAAKARWTRDRGRTWRRTAEIGPRAAIPFAVAGRRELLFWASQRGVYRVLRWPSTRLRSHRVWRPTPDRRLIGISGTPWYALAVVPDGVATLVASGRSEPSRLSVLVHRRGRNSLSRLPPAATALASIGADELRPRQGVEIRAAWPRLTVCAWAIRRGRDGGFAIGIGAVVWRSVNGGRTWRVEGVLGGGDPACP